MIGKPHSAPSGAIEASHLDAQLLLAPWALRLHKQQPQSGEIVKNKTLFHNLCEWLHLLCLSQWLNTQFH